MKLKLTLIPIALLGSTAAHAQNFQSVPLGGRTGAMGGAGAATGRDAASPLLNPGNLVLLDKDVLSLSANVYGRNIAVSDKFFVLDADVNAAYGDPEKARQALTSDVFDVFPASLGYYKYFPSADYPMVTAFSFFNASHTNYQFSGEPQILFPDGAFRASGRALYQRDVYYFGPTYAIGIKDTLRLGLSVFGIYQPITSVRQSKSLRTAANNTTFFAEEFEEYLNGSSTELQPILGAAATFGGFSVGLTAASPSFHLTGDFKSELRQNTTKPGGVDSEPSLIGIETFDGDLALRQPLRATLGLGYERPKSFAIALDATAYMAVNDAIELDGTRRTDEIKQFGVSSSLSENSTESKDYGMIIDVSAGAEIFINDTSSIRFGGFYDRSAVKFPSALSDYNQFDIKEDRIGATLGYGVSAGAFQSDFGVRGYMGSGEIVSKELFGDTFFKADLETYGILFFVAGSMDIEKTRRQFADQIAPGATEAIDAASDPGAALEGAKTRNLTLTDVSPGLSKYENEPEFNALSTQPVELHEVGNPRYDAFFEEAALLQGSVVATRQILTTAKKNLAASQGDPQAVAVGDADPVAVAKTIASNPQALAAPVLASLKHTKEALSLATDALKGIASEAQRIVLDGQDLVQAAPEDFKGPTAAHIPRIIEQLSSTLTGLASAAGEAPGLATDAFELVTAMATIPNIDVEVVAPEAPDVQVPDAADAQIPDPPEAAFGAPDVPAVAPAVAPGAGGGGGPKPCWVNKKEKTVKFRVDASHKAKPSAVANRGDEMRCHEVVNGWRRVELVSGGGQGFLPEAYITYTAPK